MTDMLAGMPERRAALLVHALPEADRAWVLDALPGGQKADLLALLQELHEMNIAPDAQWLQECLPSNPPQAAAAWTPAYGPGASLPKAEALNHADAASPDLAALGPAQLAELARLLGQEPVSLSARFLRARPWPWRDKLLSLMNASAQMQLRQALRDNAPGWEEEGTLPRPGASLDAALVDAIARRLGPARAATPFAAPAEPAAFRPRTGLAALWRRFTARPQPDVAP